MTYSTGPYETWHLPGYHPPPIYGPGYYPPQPGPGYFGPWPPQPTRPESWPEEEHRLALLAYANAQRPMTEDELDEKARREAPLLANMTEKERQLMAVVGMTPSGHHELKKRVASLMDGPAKRKPKLNWHYT